MSSLKWFWCESIVYPWINSNFIPIQLLACPFYDISLQMQQIALVYGSNMPSISPSSLAPPMQCNTEP